MNLVILVLIIGSSHSLNPSVQDDLIPGTYKLDSSNNFNAYLKELGVGYFLRKLAMLASPVVTIDRYFIIISSKNLFSSRICQAGSCKWSIKTDAVVRTHQVTFSLGELVEDFTMDRRRVKTIYTMPSRNRLVEEQMGNKVNTTLVRDFFEERMDVAMYVNDVIATSVFYRKSFKYCNYSDLVASSDLQKPAKAQIELSNS